MFTEARNGRLRRELKLLRQPSVGCLFLLLFKPWDQRVPKAVYGERDDGDSDGPTSPFLGPR